MIPSPSDIAAGIDLWLKYRPWRRMRQAIRDARNKRRARLGKPLLPPFDVTQEERTPMNDDQKSALGAGALKVAGGAVAALAVRHGLLDPSTDVSTLATLLTAFGGSAVALIGFVLAHRAHK